MAERVTLSRKYTDPLLDEGVRGWIVQTARRHFWRVAAHYELDDLIQDGYMCFANMRRHYPHVVDPAHAMGLFKRIYSNYITDLANARSAGQEMPLSQFIGVDDSEEQVLDGLLGHEDEGGTFAALLSSAPKELAQLLELFMKDITQFDQPPLWDHYYRETNNQRLCRLLGLNAQEVNLSQMFKAHFFGAAVDGASSWDALMLSIARSAQEFLSAEGMVKQA